MVQEAEKFKADDEAQKVKVEAKNGLENYCFTMKNSMNDAAIKDKLSEEDRKIVEDKTAEALAWLDSNQMAEKEEFEAKQKEVEMEKKERAQGLQDRPPERSNEAR